MSGSIPQAIKAFQLAGLLLTIIASVVFLIHLLEICINWIYPDWVSISQFVKFLLSLDLVQIYLCAALFLIPSTAYALIKIFNEVPTLHGEGWLMVLAINTLLSTLYLLSLILALIWLLVTIS